MYYPMGATARRMLIVDMAAPAQVSVTVARARLVRVSARLVALAPAEATIARVLRYVSRANAWLRTVSVAPLAQLTAIPMEVLPHRTATPPMQPANGITAVFPVHIVHMDRSTAIRDKGNSAILRPILASVA